MTPTPPPVPFLDAYRRERPHAVAYARSEDPVQRRIGERALASIDAALADEVEADGFITAHVTRRRKR